MKKHFPDWFIYILFLLIGGIIVFYTLKYGNPSVLSSNTNKARILDEMIKKQSHINAIENQSDNNWTIKDIHVAFLDSSLTIIHHSWKPKKEIQIGTTYSLQSDFTQNWKGQCIYVMIEYYRHEEPCVMNAYKIVNAEQLNKSDYKLLIK